MIEMMMVMMVMVMMKVVPFAREMRSCDEVMARLGARFVLLFSSLLFSPVLGGAFPLLSWSPGCKAGNELPFRNLPSQHVLNRRPLQRA